MNTGSFRKELGDQAEAAVAEWLRRSGFVVLERQVRGRHWEVDIVARRDSVLCIVEVRYRSSSSWRTSLGSVDADKQKRLRNAARALWRLRYGRDSTLDRVRIDVAAASRKPDGTWQVEYVPAAF